MDFPILCSGKLRPELGIWGGIMQLIRRGTRGRYPAARGGGRNLKVEVIFVLSISEFFRPITFQLNFERTAYLNVNPIANCDSISIMDF